MMNLVTATIIVTPCNFSYIDESSLKKSDRILNDLHLELEAVPKQD